MSADAHAEHFVRNRVEVLDERTYVLPRSAEEIEETLDRWAFERVARSVLRDPFGSIRRLVFEATRQGVESMLPGR